MIHGHQPIISGNFTLTLRKKGFKHFVLNHKACFEEPSCSSVNYQIFGTTKGSLGYSECHHGSSRKYDQYRLHVVFVLVV